jgi:hypothetical protein
VDSIETPHRCYTGVIFVVRLWNVEADRVDEEAHRRMLHQNATEGAQCGLENEKVYEFMESYLGLSWRHRNEWCDLLVTYTGTLSLSQTPYDSMGANIWSKARRETCAIALTYMDNILHWHCSDVIWRNENFVFRIKTSNQVYWVIFQGSLGSRYFYVAIIYLLKNYIRGFRSSACCAAKFTYCLFFPSL